MATPGRNTQRIIKKYAIDRTVRHYEERRNQTFDADGLPIDLSFTEETVKIHDQPLSGKLIKYLPEGQRLDDVRRGWTVEVDKLKEQDQVNIDGFIFTVNGVQQFQTGVYGHKEFNLLRTGEQDNLWT
jgi:hypothetical protein